ncbi:hypothetical protein GQ457_06G002740 [Hibiscus cannabinus]
MEMGNRPSFSPVPTFSHQLIAMDEYQEIEDDNDVFFRRQILALTTDEDYQETGGIHSVSSNINKQGSRRVVENLSLHLYNMVCISIGRIVGILIRYRLGLQI